MLEFLKEYKEVLVSGLAVILTIICMIIKRKPKTIDEFAKILDDVCLGVPAVVSKQEEVYGSGHGLSKKKDSYEVLYNRFVSRLGRKLSEDEEFIVFNRINKQIEDVLEAPQKKGVK